jgi:hypothetical protein
MYMISLDKYGNLYLCIVPHGQDGVVGGALEILGLCDVAGLMSVCLRWLFLKGAIADLILPQVAPTPSVACARRGRSQVTPRMSC